MIKFTLTDIKIDLPQRTIAVKAIWKTTKLSLLEAGAAVDMLFAGKSISLKSLADEATIEAAFSPFCTVVFEKKDLVTRIILDNPHVPYVEVSEEMDEIQRTIAQIRALGEGHSGLIPFTNARTQIPVVLDERIIVGLEPFDLDA